MLKPVYAVFGFLLLVAAVGSVAMLVGSNTASLPSNNANSSNPQSNLERQLKEQTEIQQSILRIIGKQSETLEKIDKIISGAQNQPNSDDSITSIGHKIADHLAAIQGMLSLPVTPPHGTLPTPISPVNTQGTGTVSVAEPGHLAMVIVCLFLGTFFAGISFIFLQQGRAKAALAAVLASAISLSGMTILGVRIEKLFHVDLSIPLNFGTGGMSEQSITILVPKVHTTRTELDCGKDDDNNNPYRISSFPDGLANPADIGGAHSEDLAKAFNPLKVQIEKVAGVLALPKSGSEDVQDNLVAIFLVGSADRRDVFGTTRHSYSSNIGLAQARAEWVLQELKDDLKNDGRFQATPIITLNSGPTLLKVGDDVERLAPDRAVRICALWEKNL